MATRWVQFMTEPIYAAATVLSIGIAYSADRLEERGLQHVFCGIIAAISWMVPLVQTDSKGRYVAVVFAACGTLSAIPLWPAFVMDLMANDPMEKRAGA
jgi:hypothetical protein